MGVIYEGINQIPTDKNYDIVKVVPPGKVVYNLENPSKVLFPGQRTSSKNGFKVTGEGARWALEDIGSYVSRYSNLLDQSTVEKLKEFLQLPKNQADYSDSEKELPDFVDDTEKLSPELKIYLEGLEELIQKEKEKQEKGEELDLEKIKDALSDLDVVLEKKEEYDPLRNLNIVIEEENLAKKNGFEVNFNRILQELEEAKKKIIEGIKQVDFRKIQEISQKRQEQVEQELEKTSERIQEGQESLEDLIKVITELSKELEESQKESITETTLDALEIDLDDLINTPELRRSLIEKELEKLENERKELEKELQEINPKEKLFLEKVLEAENLPEEEKAIVLENLKQEIDAQKQQLIRSVFDSFEQVYERNLSEFYKKQYLMALDPSKKLQSIKRIFSFLAQSRLLKDVLEGKLPTSYILDLWEDTIGRTDVIEKYLRLAIQDDEFLLSFLETNGFNLQEENFIAKTIYELRENFYALEESNQLMYLADDAADDLMIFYIEEKNEIESSVRCTEYYKLLTGKELSKEAKEFKEKISRVKEKLKNIQEQMKKLYEEEEEISAAEAIAELAKEMLLDDALTEDKSQLTALSSSLGISEDFTESLYSIQPRENLFSQLLTSFQNSLSLIRGITSFLFDVRKDRISITSDPNRYALFEQAIRILVDSYIGNLQAALEKSKEEDKENINNYRLIEQYLKENFETFYEASLGIALHYIAEAIYEAATDKTTEKIDYKNLAKNIKRYLLENKVSGSLQELEEELVYGQTLEKTLVNGPDGLKAKRCLSISALDTSDLSVNAGNILRVSYSSEITKKTRETFESILENSIRLKDYFARAILCALTHNEEALEKLLIPLANKLEQNEEVFYELRDDSILRKDNSAKIGSSLRYLSDAYTDISEEVYKIAEYVFGIFGASVEYSKSPDSTYLKITSNNTAERLFEKDQLGEVVSKLGKVIADFYRDGKVIFDAKRFSQMFKIEEEEFLLDDITIVSPIQEKEESPLKLRSEDEKAIDDFLEKENVSITVPVKLNGETTGDLSLVKNPDGSITASIKKAEEEIANSVVTKEELEEFSDQQRPSQKILDKLISTAKKFFENFINLTDTSTQREAEDEISEQPVLGTEFSQPFEDTIEGASSKEEKEKLPTEADKSKFVNFFSALGYTQDESSQTFEGLKDYLSLKTNSPEKIEEIIDGILKQVLKLPEQKKQAVSAILHSAFNPSFIYQIDSTGVDISDKDQLSSTVKRFLLGETNRNKNKIALGIEVELGTSLKSKAKLTISKKKSVFKLLQSFGIKFSKKISDVIETSNNFVEITISRSDVPSSQEKPLSVFVPEDFLLNQYAGMSPQELLIKLAAKAFIEAKIDRDSSPEEKYRKRKLNAIKKVAKTSIKEDKESLKKAAEVQDKETNLRREKKKKDKALKYAKSKEFENLESKINSINSAVSLISNTDNIPALERDFFSRYKDEQELQQAVSDILKDHVKYFTKAKNPSYRGLLPIKINDTYIQASCSFERSLPVMDENGNEIGRYLNISIDYDSPNFANLTGNFSTRIVVGEDGNLVTDSPEPVDQLFDQIKKNIEKQLEIQQEITKFEESAKENTTNISIPLPGEKTVVEVEPDIKVKKKSSKTKKSSTKKKQVKIETSDNGDITISVPAEEGAKTVEISKEFSDFIDEKDIEEAVQIAAAETVYVSDIEELEEVENAIFSTSIDDPISKKSYNVEIKKEGLRYLYTINDSSGKPIYDGVFTKLPNLKTLRTRILEDLAFVKMSSISPIPEVEQDELQESLETETFTPSPAVKPEEKSEEKIKKERPNKKESEKKKKGSKKQPKTTSKDSESLDVITSKEEVELSSSEAETPTNESNDQSVAEASVNDFEIPDDFELPEIPSDFELPSEEELEEDKVKYEIRSKIEKQKDSIIRKANAPYLSVLPDSIIISDNLVLDFEKEETSYDEIFDIKIKLVETGESFSDSKELWATTVRSDELEDKFDKILENILKNIK